LTAGRARAAAIAAALLLGCGDANEPRPAPAPAAAPAGAPAARASEPPGVRIRRETDGRLRVRAHRASRFAVLQELARTASFAVSPGIGSPPPREIDLELAGAAPEDVLEAILDDVPHHLHYAPDRGEAVLVRVTIGGLPQALRAESPPTAEETPPTEEPAAREPGSAARGDRMRPRNEGDRLDGEPPELIDALSRAPDAATRVSAARALGDVEGGEEAFRAAHALVAALADRDPAVVAAAIDALAGIHDVIPDPAQVAAVRRLRDHADPAVRAAAAEFLAWTEDEP
jgi:hypothetical protein